MITSIIILRIVLISILLVSYSGIPVVVHRCGGEVESVHVFSTTAQCGDDAECEDMECCTDTLVLSQLIIDAATAPQVDLIPSHNVDCELPFSYSLDVVISSSLFVAEFGHDHALRRPPPMLVAMRC